MSAGNCPGGDGVASYHDVSAPPENAYKKAVRHVIYGLLGELEVQGDGGPIDLPGGLALAVLAGAAGQREPAGLQGRPDPGRVGQRRDHRGPAAQGRARGAADARPGRPARRHQDARPVRLRAARRRGGRRRPDIPAAGPPGGRGRGRSPRRGGDRLPARRAAALARPAPALERAQQGAGPGRPHAARPAQASRGATVRARARTGATTRPSWASWRSPPRSTLPTSGCASCS